MERSITTPRGDANTATGASALQSNITGNNNTAIGLLALGFNTGGSSNTAVGWNALAQNTTGLNNIALGADAGGNINAANNVICIGTNLSGEDISNSCYIGNIFGQVSSSGTAVFVNSSGKLGTTTSSKRFKDDIKPMEHSSDMLFALKPVTFRYKKEFDPAGTSQFGLVAEEVEKVNPDLVVRDKEGKAYSVRYEQVNAMLLNEFLKEHKKVQELEETVPQQQENFQSRLGQQEKQIEFLTMNLQRISARLQVDKAAPQVVVKNP